MNEMLEILKALKAGQEYLIAKVDSIDLRLSRVEGKVDSIDLRLLSKVEGDVKDMKDGQERHERILESLALKYVEHDVEIKGIKQRQ